MEIRVETSTAADGNMSTRWGETAVVAANRARFLERCGLVTERLVMCRIPQPNGVSIVEVDEGAIGSDVDADALMTRGSVILGLLTADCLPVAMSDGTEWYAIAHCGWESTGLRLPEALVQAFGARGSRPTDLRVSIAPSIHALSYVRPYRELAQKDDPRWQPFLTKVGDDAQVDLHAYVREQLCAAGVLPERIRMHPSDTFTDRAYFSHRRAMREGALQGRMLTVVSR